jgi:hypothetical protein
MGSKAETFCLEDMKDQVVVPVLKIFKEYKVPMIIETKSHFIGMKKYLDLIKDMNVAVIVSIMGGSDTLNYKLEPGSPPPSMRWALVKMLNELGIWTAVRWEPILVGINTSEDIFENYAEMAKRSGAKHVSFLNYRTSNYKIAQKEFEKRGYNYVKLLNNNLDENWVPVGKKFRNILKKHGIPASSPDFVNFPFNNSCESCCGIDGLFPKYEFTFQRACKIILEKGQVCWNDMEEITFREPEAYQRMKECWNGKGQYFSLKDSPETVILDKDGNGMNIYGKASADEEAKKEGLLF